MVRSRNLISTPNGRPMIPTSFLEAESSWLSWTWSCLSLVPVGKVTGYADWLQSIKAAIGAEDGSVLLNTL